MSIDPSNGLPFPIDDIKFASSELPMQHTEDAIQRAKEKLRELDEKIVSMQQKDQNPVFSELAKELSGRSLGSAKVITQRTVRSHGLFGHLSRLARRRPKDPE